MIPEFFRHGSNRPRGITVVEFIKFLFYRTVKDFLVRGCSRINWKIVLLPKIGSSCRPSLVWGKQNSLLCLSIIGSISRKDFRSHLRKKARMCRKQSCWTFARWSAGNKVPRTDFGIFPYISIKSCCSSLKVQSDLPSGRELFCTGSRLTSSKVFSGAILVIEFLEIVSWCSEINFCWVSRGPHLLG